MTEPLIDEDALLAAVELVGRSGARQFDVGYLDGDVPSSEARWWASAYYKGARLQADEHRGPVEAAEALARRILDGGTCQHCGGYTVVGAGEIGVLVFFGTVKSRRICRWVRTGPRWDRTCAPSINTEPTAPAPRPSTCAPPINRADQRRRDRASRKGRS